MYKGNQLAKIHIGKKDLAMNDGDYRAFLKGLTGKESAKDLTDKQKLLVIMEMKKRGAFRTKPLNGQQRVCVAKWYKLRQLGEVNSKDKSSLNRFCKNKFNKWNICDLTTSETNQLIGMLESWIDKTEHNVKRSDTGVIQEK